MEYLRVVLFGGFQAAPPSARPLIVPTRKAQALLAYCLVPPGRVHQREKLAALLWGETRDDQARNSLRQCLFVLKSALGSNVSRALSISGDTVAIDAHAVEVDVARFERLAASHAAESLEEAVSLYRGDFLEGLVIDEEPFEEWLRQERERLRDVVMEVLARLLHHQCAQQATGAAMKTARRLVGLDPLQEAVHRALMRLHMKEGRRDLALRQYDVCAAVLKRELGLSPESETRRLRDEILSGAPLAHATLPGHSEEAGSVSAAAIADTRNVAESATDSEVPAPGQRRHRVAFAAVPARVEYHALLEQATRERERLQQLVAELHSRRLLLQGRMEEMANRAMVLKRLLPGDTCLAGPARQLRA
ncbi:MAG TPA: BTAD domain-containing putative transcriptional regulator [Methylomirabilota bacterium]|jgi:DNA-binding SARP family transcriptional activator|nr:BTAD domain-containing putative transcriptional regulator [Methylomirabilota bacterium]